MSGEINRVPTGLLNALDMTARGTTPRTLASEVQAGIDIRDLYELGREVTVVGLTATINAVGPWGVTGLVVPEREYWRITNMAVIQNTGLAASTTYRVAVGVRRTVGTVPYALTFNQPQESTATQAIFCGWVGSFWARPTDQPVICVERVTVGIAIPLTLSVTYVPYSI